MIKGHERAKAKSVDYGIIPVVDCVGHWRN